MEYCRLGQSGLQVSRIGLGAIPFGTVIDTDTCIEMADMFLDAGGNLIDTSNLYGGGLKGSNTGNAGTSEKTVGKIIKGRRDQFVVASKGYWLMEDEVTPNSVGLSRKYLTKNLEESLQRLGTDYIDVYQCHCWDFYTPVEETMEVMDNFVKQGKIRYVGVSNWDGWHVVKANMYAKANGLCPIVSNQIWYTLADRSPENAIIPACRDQNVSVLVWGAVAEGFLCGKYRRGNEAAQNPSPKMLMAKDTEMNSWKNLAIDRNWDTIEVIAEIAEKRNRSFANIAVRWLLDAGTSDVLLLGASKIEQVKNNLETMDFQLTEEEVARLREVSEPPHPYPNCFYDLFCYEDSEFYGGLR